MQLFNRLLIESQILLATDQDDGKTVAEVQHLGDPLSSHITYQHLFVSQQIEESEGESSHLLLNVVERIRRIDGEADQNHMRIRIGQRAQAIIVFLPGRIPERQLDVFAVHFDIGDVVLKHGRDVHLDVDLLVDDEQPESTSAFQVDGDARRATKG